MSRPTQRARAPVPALKAPAAARALPKLADRARDEEWSYEQFAAALLKTEIDSRDSHGGQARIKAARFPARKTLEEFDFAFQTSITPRRRSLHLGQLDFLAGQRERRPARPARHRQDAPGDRARDPRLPGRPPRRVPHRHRMGRPARRRPTPGRLDDRARQLQRIPLLIVDEVGYIPFDPQAANLMFMLVCRRYERASLIVTSNKPFCALGRDLRRRRHRRRHDRPARPPRRDPRPQGRLLPPQRPRPRPPASRQNPPKPPDRSPSARSPQARRTPLYAPRPERRRATPPLLRRQRAR